MGFESEIKGNFFIDGEKLGHLESLDLTSDDETPPYDTFKNAEFSGTIELSRWSWIKLKWIIFKSYIKSAIKLWI